MAFPIQNFRNFIKPWKNDIKVYRQLEEFSRSLGWFPSDIVEEKNTDSIATGHIFVEHGLDNVAVISFLKENYSYDSLSLSEQNDILKVSYNNLVDLHISVDNFKVHGLNNRIKNGEPIYSGPISSKSFDNLSSNFYVKLLEEKNIKTNLGALDDVLINTISYWKRRLSSELNKININESLSNLFNAIIFCRAIEDYKREKEFHNRKILIDCLENKSSDENLVAIIEKVLKKLNIKKWPTNLINKDLLMIFDKIDGNILFKLFSDFYFIKDTPYQYDFSIISKHALSRIYERYVAILKIEETPQFSFFPEVPVETKNKSTGSYYTPQYIARYFSRYIEKYYPNFKSENVKIVEPAVGSGIFLRTLLERKIEDMIDVNPAQISKSFDSISGVDINPTACQAAKLSLSLLHLISTGMLPNKDLNIINADSLDFFSLEKNKNFANICISNPPFVAYNLLNNETREKLKNVLQESSFGKTDLYLAFVKIAIDILKPKGVGLLVLPNTFLISDSAKTIRTYLTDNAFIKCVVDLSQILVFNDTGIYPILIIFEKYDKKILEDKKVYQSIPYSTIVTIQENVGKALLDSLNEVKVESSSYNIYEVNQDFFANNTWHLLSPTEFSLKNKLDKLPKLKTFAKVRTGFSSGHKEVFLKKKNERPKGEYDIYIPYLRDREMGLYDVPKSSEYYLFYPFIENKVISKSVLEKNYPETYKSLLTNKKVLEKRPEVIQGKLEWWKPQRPRKPDFMLVPKIVTPHLVFTPKFSVDISGKFAVSRTPFIVLKDDNLDMLYYFTAVLNSSVCFWYLMNLSPKYQKGYAMLEKNPLLELPIPDPNENMNTTFQIIKLVKERMVAEAHIAIFLDKKIDTLVTKQYKLSNSEIRFLNLNID